MLYSFLLNFIEKKISVILLVSAPAICTAWGDPHYITFDERKYDFQGDCDYTLVQKCQNTSDLPSFKVTVDNIKNKPSDKVSYTDKVNLEMLGTVFSLRQGGEVRLNGAIVSLPLQHFPTGVLIKNAGSSHVVSNLKSCLNFEC